MLGMDHVCAIDLCGAAGKAFVEASQSIRTDKGPSVRDMGHFPPPTAARYSGIWADSSVGKSA